MTAGRQFHRVCVIGCGLIGGSLAFALKQTGLVERIVGYDVDRKTLTTALERGAIDELTERLDEALKGADLVIIAAPVPTTVSLLEVIARREPLLAEGAIITDVGGTKRRVVDVAQQVFKRSVFIGGHPMAGSEKSGIAAANARLLENAVYVLTPLDSTDAQAFRDLSMLIQATGARVRRMSAERHDRIVAAISHVPHLIAAALVNQVRTRAMADPLHTELAAGGFRDITRIASSDPLLWRDMTMENDSEIIPLLDEWISVISDLKKAITANEADALTEFFGLARQFRDAIPAKTTGAIRAVFSLTVSVPDEPGLIGVIASLLGKADISIRNIGIMESREGDDGQLLLQFDTADFSGQAADLLRSCGYAVTERE